MRFINNGVMPACFGMPIVAPVKKWIDHHRLRHKGAAIFLVWRSVRIVEKIWKHRLIPLHLALNRSRVGIQQELRWITTMPLLQSPRPMNTETISLTRSNVRQITMPAKAGDLREVDAAFVPLVVEKTKLDSVRDFRKDREVSSSAIV